MNPTTVYDLRVLRRQLKQMSPHEVADAVARLIALLLEDAGHPPIEPNT